MKLRVSKNKTARALLSLLFSLTFFTSVCAETLAKLDKTIVFPLLAPRLSSGYGNRNHPIFKAVKHHSGVDLAAPEESHERSDSEGDVIFAGTLPGYGKIVSIKHDDNFVSLYGHLSKIEVSAGDKISAGKVIGRVGHTGHATGPHLHFEWRKNGQALNPLAVFPEIAADPVG